MSAVAHYSANGERMPDKPKKTRVDGEIRRQKFLVFIREGRSVQQACNEMGISIFTYERWRQRWPGFRAEMDRARGVHYEKKHNTVSDFFTFRKQYLGMETYHHQARIVDALEQAKPMSVTMVLVPPEHGKTTVMEDWICYKLGKDPDHRITVVSEGMPHARKIIGRVSRRMTDGRNFPDYIARFGPFRVDNLGREQVWTKDYFTVYKASHDERDYSLEARGAGSAIYGTRVDTLIVDDIQSRRNLNMTARLLESFRQDFVTRVGREGRIIIVGTRVDMEDFYLALQESGIVDELICLPATTDEIVPCNRGDECDHPELDHLRPLCPEMWPPHELAVRRRQVTEPIWWRAYQQMPQADGEATFTDDMIEAAKDYGRRVHPSDKPTIVSLDPSLVGGNALVAMDYDATDIRILDCQVDYGLPRTEEILGRVEEFAARYHPHLLVVERNAFQRGLARDERLDAIAGRWGFRVVEHETGRNKSDEILGVGSMAGSFIRKEITLPYEDDFARRRMAPLISELRAWRPNIPTKLLRQDLVMALWFGWRTAMEQRASVVVETIKRDACPWRPMGYRAHTGGSHRQQRIYVA